MHLCLLDLVQFTGGQLRLAAMPPRDGELTVLGQIVLDAAAVQPGDVYWCVNCLGSDVELAYMRGALGVVIAERTVEPWPGRFCVVVEDSVAALEQFAVGMSDRTGEEFLINPPELKVLQLCADASADIYPPTCGRATKGQAAKVQPIRRCRRRAG